MYPFNNYENMNNVELKRVLLDRNKKLERLDKLNDDLRDDMTRVHKENTEMRNKLELSEFVLIEENARLTTEVSRLRDNLASSQQHLIELYTAFRVLMKENMSMQHIHDELSHENDLLVNKSVEYQRNMSNTCQNITNTTDGESLVQRVPPPYRPRTSSNTGVRQYSDARD